MWTGTILPPFSQEMYTHRSQGGFSPVTNHKCDHTGVRKGASPKYRGVRFYPGIQLCTPSKERTTRVTEKDDSWLLIQATPAASLLSKQMLLREWDGKHATAVLTTALMQRAPPYARAWSCQVEATGVSCVSNTAPKYQPTPSRVLHWDTVIPSNRRGTPCPEPLERFHRSLRLPDHEPTFPGNLSPRSQWWHKGQKAEGQTNCFVSITPASKKSKKAGNDHHITPYRINNCCHSKTPLFFLKPKLNR